MCGALLLHPGSGRAEQRRHCQDEYEEELLLGDDGCEARGYRAAVIHAHYWRCYVDGQRVTSQRDPWYWRFQGCRNP